jgi:hypothetical protein
MTANVEGTSTGWVLMNVSSLFTLTIRKGGAFVGKRDFRPAKEKDLVPGATLWLKTGRVWSPVVYQPADAIPTPTPEPTPAPEAAAFTPALELEPDAAIAPDIVPEVETPPAVEQAAPLETRITPATPTATTGRRKPGRKVAYHQINDRVGTLEMTIGEGEKAVTFGYYVEPVASDFGAAFTMTKYRTQQKPDEPAAYATLLDLSPEDPGHPRHSCECLGFLRWGHRSPCKHVASLLALHRSGKLACDRPASAA